MITPENQTQNIRGPKIYLCATFVYLTLDCVEGAFGQEEVLSITVRFFDQSMVLRVVHKPSKKLQTLFG